MTQYCISLLTLQIYLPNAAWGGRPQQIWDTKLDMLQHKKQNQHRLLLQEKPSQPYEKFQHVLTQRKQTQNPTYAALWKSVSSAMFGIKYKNLKCKATQLCFLLLNHAALLSSEWKFPNPVLFCKSTCSMSNVLWAPPCLRIFTKLFTLVPWRTSLRRMALTLKLSANLRSGSLPMSTLWVPSLQFIFFLSRGICRTSSPLTSGLRQ